MPRGVPVATVAINNATNAGLLAVRMLGVSDPDLQARWALSLSLSLPLQISVLTFLYLTVLSPCILHCWEKKTIPYADWYLRCVQNEPVPRRHKG